jgi:pilus assembly protein CpaB
LASKYFHESARARRRGSSAPLAIVASVGAVCSIAGAGALYLRSEPPSQPSKVIVERERPLEMVRVLVPINRIEPGTELIPDLFREESRPAVGISSKTIKTVLELKGHYAFSAIAADEPLLSTYITPIKPVNQITAAIPPGYRAVTINVDERTSVEGWARAGAKVDVVWGSRIRGKEAATVIVQNAKVLSAERRAAGDQITNGMPVPSTVTLLVPDGESNKIQLASTTGTISLALRGENDGSAAGATRSITTDDLLGRTPPGPERAVHGKIKVREKNGTLREYGLSASGEMIPLGPDGKPA